MIRRIGSAGRPAATPPRRRSGRPAGRVRHLQVVERVGDDVRDREVPEPVRLAGITYHGAVSVEQRASIVLEGGDVLVPELPLREVADAELPALRRVVERAWNRASLLVRDRSSRKNLRIVVPASVSSFSNALIWS